MGKSTQGTPTPLPAADKNKSPTISASERGSIDVGLAAQETVTGKKTSR